MRQQQVDQTPLFEYTDLSTRMIVRRVFKILLYFVGGFLAEFGLLAIGLYVSNMNNQFGYATVLVGLIGCHAECCVRMYNEKALKPV